MLNLKEVERKFKEEINDIIRYETYYSKDPDHIFERFEDRFHKYIDRDWEWIKNHIDYNIWRTSHNPYTFYVKIVFDEQCTEGLSFGFEVCLPVDMIMRTKLGVD